MNLDAQIAQIIRDVLGDMLDERFDALEDRIAARVTAAAEARSDAADAPPPLLDLRRTAAYHDVAPRTLQRMVADEEFPPPIPVRPGRARWRQGDVDAWLDQRRGRE